MKNRKLLASAFIALITCVGVTEATAQWGAWGGGFGRPMGRYGRLNRYRFQPLGSVKITADIDYSGKIDSKDARLGNNVKRNPYGLVIGTNEMTKLVLRCKPNQDRYASVGTPSTKLPFYKLTAALEIKGINLADKKGRFRSFEDEVDQCGRILVWLDSSRRYLLLDSADPNRRRVEWPYASSVPPERVYVQAVDRNQPGTAFHITYSLDDSNLSGVGKLFGEPAIWDRVLVSTHTPHIPKPYIDTTPVWVYTGGSGGAGNTK